MTGPLFSSSSTVALLSVWFQVSNRRAKRRKSSHSASFFHIVLIVANALKDMMTKLLRVLALAVGNDDIKASSSSPGNFHLYLSEASFYVVTCNILYYSRNITVPMCANIFMAKPALDSFIAVDLQHTAPL